MKFVIPFFLFLFSFCSASAQTALPKSVRDKLCFVTLRAADSSYYHGKYGAASKIYKLSLAYDPSNEYLKFRVQQTRHAIYDALTRESLSYRNSLGLAKFQFGTKKYLDTYKYLEHARLLNPTNDEAYQLMKSLDSVSCLPEIRKNIYDKIISATDTLLLFPKNDQRVLDLFSELKEFEGRFPNNKVQQIDHRIDSLKRIYPRLVYEILLHDGLKHIQNGELDQAELKLNQAMELYDDLSDVKIYLEFLNRIREAQTAQKSGIDQNLTCFNDCFQRKDVVHARECYLNLRYLRYTNPDLEKRMEEMILMIDNWRLNDPDRFYSLLIQEGDYANLHHELLDAKAFYQQALQLKSNEAYPIKQITKIDYFFSIKK